jgi:hypothetical protein
VLKKLLSALFPPRPPAAPRFWYTWQAHPFDDPQYFHVDAATKEEADTLAMKRFTGMFDRGETVMTEFFPMKNPPPLVKSFRPY